MKILAVDVGKKRIGIATCDPLEIAANPFSVIKAGKNAVNDVLKIIEEESIRAVVIGLPVSFSGSEGESCSIARFFKNQLAKRTEVEIEFFDERLTSKIAEASLIEGGYRREERRGKIDAVAAAIILQGYLELRRTRGISP